MTPLSGIWLPIITPFTDSGDIDEITYRNLIRHYLKAGISGIIPLGTTGESPCVTASEYEMIVETTASEVDRHIPVYAGIGGNFTTLTLNRIKRFEAFGIDGILSVCPYYNKPSQDGLYAHFLKLSEATTLNIIIYNIPHRTGINLENETLLRLAEQENIVAVKDACGNITQSLDLLAQKPDGFSVLTGEDRMFYTMLTNGGEGGILAAAHLQTQYYIAVMNAIADNDHKKALRQWRQVEGLISLLFAEPNPAPIKYALTRMGLIPSDTVRLPLTRISDELKRKLSERVF